MFLLLRTLARPLVIPSRRSFYLTPTRHAVENKDVFFKAFQNTSLFKQLANHPEAVVALKDFAKVLQDKGVDLSSGKPPSTFQMLKLASNSEFRESAQRVGEELQKAGVDMQSRELMQEITELMKVKRGE